MIVRLPGFAHEFFWEHHVSRFLNGMNHPEPIWYYLVVLLVACVPWCLLLVPALRFQFTRDLPATQRRSADTGYYLLLGGWCLLFFSLASCKLPSYILPAFPMLAILVAVYLNYVIFCADGEIERLRSYRKMPVNSVILLSLTGVGVTWTSWGLGIEELYLSLLESTLCGVVLAVMLIYQRRMSAPVAWACCAAMSFFVLMEVNSELVPKFARSRSPASYSPQVAKLLADRDVAVAIYGREWGSVPFYLAHDDVQHFDTLVDDDWIHFLSAHPRTLIVQGRAHNIHPVRRLLPPGLQVTKMCDAGRATYWFVHPQHVAQRPAKRKQPYALCQR